MKSNTEYSALAFDEFEIFDSNIKKIGNDILSEYFTYKKDSIIFILIEKGKGMLNIDSAEHHVKKQTLLIILPGYQYSNLQFSKNITFKLFSLASNSSWKFSLLTGINLFENIYSAPCVSLKNDQYQSLVSYFSFLIAQNNWTDYPYREALSKTFLSSFLIHMAGIYTKHLDNSPKLSRNKELFLQFNNLLFENIKRERSVQFYADKMFLSAKYLSLVIKEVSGKTMTEWIKEWSISTIKIMLRTSNLTSAQIADELNFSNPSFMGRYFKRYTHMTPLEYRNSLNL